MTTIDTCCLLTAFFCPDPPHPEEPGLEIIFDGKDTQ